MPEAVTPARRSVLPVAIGIALTCAFLLLLAYLGQRRDGQPRVVPDLTILSPLAGAAVDSPLIIRFSAAPDVSLLPTGWGFERLHLHAWIDGVAYMPAASDIRTTGPGTHHWTIPVARRGRRHVQLGWADAVHRELGSGRSDAVEILIQ
jgi:hypothetical protein